MIGSFVLVISEIPFAKTVYQLPCYDTLLCFIKHVPSVKGYYRMTLIGRRIAVGTVLRLVKASSYYVSLIINFDADNYISLYWLSEIFEFERWDSTWIFSSPSLSFLWTGQLSAINNIWWNSFFSYIDQNYVCMLKSIAPHPCWALTSLQAGKIVYIFKASRVEKFSYD